MNQIKVAFTDGELLRYGRGRGFLENLGTSLLADTHIPDQEGYLEITAKQNPEFQRAVDYIAASLMRPYTSLRIYGESGDGYIRMRCAAPSAGMVPTDYAMVYRAGQEGLLSVESSDGLLTVLREFAGPCQGEAKRESFSISTGGLLVVLAACDVAAQNRFQGGRFTEASLMNAYDLREGTDFGAVCAPLADAAGPVLLDVLEEEGVRTALQELESLGVICSDILDSVRLYGFTPEYAGLLGVFTTAFKRLALYRWSPEAELTVSYFISGPAGVWLFALEGARGRIERLDEASLESELHRSVMLQEKQAPQGIFCSQCGTMLSAEARFCGQCGSERKMNA